MKSTVKRILFAFTYVVASCGLVEGWSCQTMSTLYSRAGNDVTIRLTVAVASTPIAYQVYSYNTYLGSLVIYTNGFNSAPQPGISISGDVTGNINITVSKVQVSSAGLYRIATPNIDDRCRILYILGKPTKPAITSNKDPTVGENVILTCSSTSNTVPSNHSRSMKYTWKINNKNVPTDARYILSNTGATLTVNNVIKTDAQDRFTCTAQEDVSQAYMSDNSNTFAINVLYPPGGRPAIGNNVDGDTYSVIDKNTGTLSCTIKGGNPRPTLTWTCYNQAGEYTYPDTQTVTQTVTWTATRETDARCTCRCPEAVSGQQSTYVNVKILYPPSTPSFTINSQAVSGANIKVIKGKSFTVTCNSKSEPAPSSYTWKRPGGSSLVDHILKVNNVQTSHNGQYSCEVENTMRPSSGGTVPGSADRNIQLLVLYPPEIGALSNKSISEGSSLQLPCNYTAGSPAETTFKWTRNGDQRVWNTQQLTISNVSRTDDMIYTCTIYNTMNPTNEIEVNGEKSESFHLNVLYKTSITAFYIQGYENRETVTVDETTDVEFTCHVESNPGSRISVLFDDKIIKSVTGSDVTHTTKAVTCLDTGIYKCTGQNDYNAGKPSVKKVTMHVQCRPTVYHITQENITSAQNNKVALKVRILANPRPDTVTWQIWQGNKWILVQENELVKTSTVPLQINDTLLSVTQMSLTFLNVTLSNFGRYRMVAKNSFSNVTQQFYLQSQDTPDPPTEFVNTGNHLSKVTVLWKPGFDGGLRQTFILRYKRDNDVDWKEVEIVDTGKKMMSYTISDLSAGTGYQLRIYARNDIGNSSLSAILLVKTTEEVKPGTNAALIGGAVGGVLLFAVLVVVGVLLLKWFRNKKGKDSSEVELDGRTNVNGDEESSEDEVRTENAMHQSAGDVKQGESNIYAKPQKKFNVVQGGDVYAVVKKPDKSGHKKKEKIKTNKAQTPALENSADLKDGKTNSAYNEYPYANPLVEDNGMNPKRNKNKDGLIYADLTFNDKPKGQKKVVIHGLDSTTEYVEVDFTKKADPLPDSDEEEKPDARK